MFDDKVTLARPYHFFVLHEIFENSEHSQMKDITQKLNLQFSSDQLVLASQLDPSFLSKVIELDNEF